MGTTNSTKHELNSYLVEGYDNSGVQTWVITNTGNNDRKKGLPVLCDTYTLSTSSSIYGAADINVKLLNWNEAVYNTGAEITAGPGLFNDVKFEADTYYAVYGNPDKYVYDYQQDYNNCGVNSCLNLLSIAGKKDIVEVNSSYQEYLSSPIITKKKQLVWDEETGNWKQETKEIVTYPKAKVETEDEFLLWAVQNSPNDSEWYDTMYPEDTYPEGLPSTDGNIRGNGDEEINDYVVHSKNCEEYEKIADIQATPLELGGTTITHRDNILNYWGLDSEMLDVEIKGLRNDLDTAEHVISIDYVDNGDGTWTRTTKKEQSNETGKTIIETTLVEKVEEGDPNDKSNWKVLESTETKITTDILNKDFYSFGQTLAALVKEGKGIILAGYANSFFGEKGGGHAISLVGVVEGPQQYKKTEVTHKVGEGEEVKQDPVYESQDDILGFYVVDTGGFLTDGLETERAQFIDCKSLYNFLTDTSYGGGTYIAEVNCTNEEIRSWADNMNIKGNDRKNLLYGNDSQNYIWGNKGNDVLYGAGGNDYLYGEKDNDTIYGGQGNDVMEGGSGHDTYIFLGTDLMEEHETSDINTAKGSHDYLVVGSGKDSIQFDNVTGDLVNASGDVVGTFEYANTPVDKMKYQNKDGNLVIDYTITRTYTLNDGTTEVGYNNNSITIKNYFKKQLYSSIGQVLETDNGEFTDRSFNFVQDILSRGYIDYFSYAQKNNKITGSKFMDSIIGGNKNDSITGGSGNDIINGGASNDTIKGGSGNDVIYGSYGNDKIYGDSGNDVIKYQTSAAADEDASEFAGGAFGGHDTIYSGSGVDRIELHEYKRSDLTLTKAKNDLVITYKKGDTTTDGGSITISGYFSKKGKTSIYDIILNNGSEVLGLRSDYKDILAEAQLTTGNDGYDYIKGTKANDSLLGGYGHDTIYGGNGNDTLNGGHGSDKLYGQSGDNTYIFDSKALGNDTIYVSGKGKTTLDFTDSGIDFNSKGSTGAVDEYSFTKNKNDLIINYATDTNLADSDNSKITISNFFKSSGAFEIISSSADVDPLNIKTQATIYMNGDDEKKNKITGSSYNDLIIGYDYNDTFNGGKGNDTINAGKGNDVITGGAGENTIQYAKGDGMDTINLTKGEKLKIDLTGFDIDTTADAKTRIFDYNIVKNNLVISYIDENGKSENILTLKNFGTKDVTTSSGSVELYNNGTKVVDLREGKYLDDYVSFTTKKYSYSGKWQSEVIDARALNLESPKKDKGAKISAKAGNDTIYGSDWNDTIDAGDGDDVIYAGNGKNTVNGGKGSDEYHLFYDKVTNQRENTTIKDSGKATQGTDTANIYVEDLTQIQTRTDIENKYSNQGSIWFNIKKSGKQPAITFNVTTYPDANQEAINKATITGVENIIIKDVERDADGNITSTTSYKYNYDQVVSAVTNWLAGTNYKDVAQVMNGDSLTDKTELLAIFTDKSYFTEIV